MASEIEVGSKYIPEMPKKEKEELRSSIKAASIKVIKENIKRMKKTWPNRPETMEYFDEISNFFGRREKEIREKKRGRKKDHRLLLHVRAYRIDLGCRRHSSSRRLGMV